MISHISNTLGQRLLNLVLRNESFTPTARVYLGLLASHPGVGGACSEVSGAGYARRGASFDSPTQHASTLAEPVRFHDATSGWGTITHVGVFGDETGGEPLFRVPLGEAIAVEALDVVRIAAGDVTVAFGGAVSSDLADALLARVLRAGDWAPIAGVHLALLSAFTDDDTYTEMSGDGYARRSCAFAPADDAGSVNATALAFPAAASDWPAITHAALFDAASGGRMLWRGELDATRTVSAGRQLVIAQGGVRVTLD